MAYPFQIVFRFPEESPLTSADVEDDIAEALGNELDDPTADHVVEGNEIGDDIDIFVSTREPHSAFSLYRPRLEQMGLLDSVIVAWRTAEDSDFLVIHPPNFSGPFIL